MSLVLEKSLKFFSSNIPDFCVRSFYNIFTLKKIEPEVIFPGGFGINFKIASALTDFPEPDSPTIASVSPFLTFHETSLTALTVRPLTSNSTLRFFISKATFFHYIPT